MDIFLTIISGVIVYVAGQLILKLVIEPVHEMKKTIGKISHSLIENGQVIANPGFLGKEGEKETSRHLRALSSQLQASLYLVPKYDCSSILFGLPPRAKILSASTDLIALSHSVYETTEVNIYERNAKKKERICDSLGIFMSEDERWPKDLQ
ncbi:MAG: hypothetical protein U1D41_11945 [Nitrosomonas sp.]|uniref:hypothetical protein n=1 Tax=Nitrosomonas sp. TaxID=42353 RepID=UPI0027209DFC|nr:hypothetical protein [Nitrosomonas sp.]MDO8992684.1 hypothetical protein [Daejeonella sp.]MDP3282541.1 hypothetical protein [Nitrosomonas sp.]MDP3663173.1 hypothetical protein [Nitrosomonas sp.]MDZ4106851.1 hypothetical protein [Nitrosomonas sp.]